MKKQTKKLKLRKEAKQVLLFTALILAMFVILTLDAKFTQKQYNNCIEATNNAILCEDLRK